MVNSNVLKACFMIITTSISTAGLCTPEIKRIESDQVQHVKRIIIDCYFELLNPTITLEQFEKELEAHDEFEDLVNIQDSYFNNGGTFLVLVDQGKVIGSGAIRKFDGEICELMRLFFLKEYRGKGLGFKITQQLLAFAKEQGYKKIRLDVYYPELQKQAIALYKKLGFYEIPAYNNYPAQLWMEKML
jgi:putative acetyltransferase